MKNLILFFCLLISTSVIAQTQLVKTKVDSTIRSQLQTPLRPAGVVYSSLLLSQYARQADSTAKTKENFVVPGSSSSYWNGTKQWILVSSITGLNWNGLTLNRPTTLAGYGITDAFNPSSTPSLIPTGTDVQVIGGSFKYYANAYLRSVYFNSTARIDGGATEGVLNVTGILKGNGSQLTNIPYIGIANPPSIPTNADYVDKVSSQSGIFGPKSWSDKGNFLGSWSGYQANYGLINQAGRISFSKGTDGLVGGSIGYSSAIDGSDFQVRANSDLSLFSGNSLSMKIYSSGNVVIGAGADQGYKLDIGGQSIFRGSFNVSSGSISGLGSGITGLPWTTGISGKPTTIDGYGITNAPRIFTFNTINDVTFPIAVGFILILQDTNFSATPKVQMYYSDGTATSTGDLYTFPFDKLSNLN